MPDSFKREPPPLPMRIMMGAMMDGVVGPLSRGMEMLGRGDRMLRAMGRRQAQELTRRNPFEKYVPTEHDVFVAVYVKSGTNWTMQIAHQLLNHGEAEYEHIHYAIPWPETKTIAWMKNYAVPLEDESVWRASPEQKRVIKTHVPASLLPYSEKARYIHVIRDPKDVFVSSYFFFGNVFPIPSVDTWFKSFCSDDFPMWGSWAHSAAGYWAQRHRPNVLVLSFKEMKRDLPGVVRRMAEFLDVRAGDDVLRKVCEKSSFQYMKSIDEKFEVWNIIPWRRKTAMMRKGALGGSSELLSAERQQEMDAYFMGALKRLGSDLPYEQFCDVSGKSLAADAK